MKGWKTKTGAIIAAVGGALLAVADICPKPEWIPWVKFAGTGLLSVGGSLGVVGVAHKIEKTGK